MNSCRRLFLFVAILIFTAGVACAQQSKAGAQKAARAKPTHPNLVYATVGGQPLRLDLYLPAASGKPVPVLIHIHGGGWRQGTKDNMPPYIMGLRAMGWALVGVQYRLTSQAGQWGDAPVCFPAQIQDVKGAVRWLRANAKKYNLDPGRFAAWGESAGGHLTALLVTSGGVKELEGDVGGNLEFSSAVQAGVDYFGPTDMLHIMEDTTRASTATRAKSESPNNSIALLVGYTGKDSLRSRINDPNEPFVTCRRKLELANPITFVGPKTPPLFIGHGTEDPLVPLNQSRRLEAALKQAGAKVQMIVTEGAGHGGLSVETHLGGIRFLCEALAPEMVAMVDAFKLSAAKRK